MTKQERFGIRIIVPENCGKGVGFSLDYDEKGNVITPEGENGQLVEDNPECPPQGFIILKANGEKIKCRERSCPFYRD